MIKTIKLLAIALLSVAAGFAQLKTTSTTLSVLVTANSSAQWCVSSATGISLPSLSGNTSGTILFVDREAAIVTSQGTSATCFNVKRGQLGTTAQFGHSTTATVWVGNPATGSGDNSRPFTGIFISSRPSGTCTASAQYSLPVINTGSIAGVGAGEVWDCVAGYWTMGTPQANRDYPIVNFTTLAVPNSIVTAGSTTHVDGKTFFSKLHVPYNAKLTGACWLNGATITTDNTIVILWDADGTVIANSALTGYVDSGGTASGYSCTPFLSTVLVYGPNTYWIGVQTKGTTDNILTYVTGGAPTGYATGSKTGTFGTVTAITPTTTFTTAVGPLMMTY